MLNFLRTKTKRVQIVIIGNMLFSFYYFYFFIGSFFFFDELPAINTFKNGIAFLGMSLGAYYLSQGKRLGKTLTQFVAVLGMIYFIGYIFYGFTFIGKPGYSSVVLISYTIGYISNILIRFAYPIIAGFVILRKPDTELNLK